MSFILAKTLHPPTRRMRSAHSRYLAGSRRAPITVVTFSFKNLLLDFQLLPLPLCNHFPKAHLCPTNLMRP